MKNGFGRSSWGRKGVVPWGLVVGLLGRDLDFDHGIVKRRLTWNEGRIGLELGREHPEEREAEEGFSSERYGVRKLGGKSGLERRNSER